MTVSQTVTARPKRQRRVGLTTFELRRENAQLRERLAKLAALVDHYYGAYRENHSLLERRERELAELRRRVDSRPVPLQR